jgi:hypothetical protein
MTGSSATKTISVDVTGKQNLQLIVTDAGDGNGSDHADWANAQLTGGTPLPDTQAPTAVLVANNLTTTPNSTTPYTFTVAYSDSTAVKLSSIDNNDLLVTGPNNYSQPAKLVSVNSTTDGSPLTATYQISAPGGSWDANEAGSYFIALQSNQVTDISGNAIVAATLGNFQVAIGSTVYVSDLNWTSTTNGWGPVEKDKSNGEQAIGDGTTITLNGISYTKGLGVHANSEVDYALGGNYTRFTSDIGVDDESGARGTVVFQVWADGGKLYDSGVMTGSSATKTISVDVTGKQNLQLIVTDAGDGNGSDHADWDL